jgi:hypothetical protein
MYVCIYVYVSANEWMHACIYMSKSSDLHPRVNANRRLPLRVTVAKPPNIPSKWPVDSSEMITTVKQL